jgi:hypothetical protein
MNQHFVEILRAFRDEDVEYLVIGARTLDDRKRPNATAQGAAAGSAFTAS